MASSLDENDMNVVSCDSVSAALSQPMTGMAHLSANTRTTTIPAGRFSRHGQLHTPPTSLLHALVWLNRMIHRSLDVPLVIADRGVRRTTACDRRTARRGDQKGILRVTPPSTGAHPQPYRAVVPTVVHI